MNDFAVFLRFGMVGVIGFVVDAAILALMLSLGLGFYWGRACSYATAASCTWALNRSWTFHDGNSRRVRQWAQFLAMNSIGGAVNYGVYALIVSYLDGAYLVLPFLAIATGSICGLGVNFALSKRFVFGRA
jgi:putative flippase GtrA